MKRLNGVDALMLYSETPEIHMHTLKVFVLDVSAVEGGYSFELFRSTAYPRLLDLAPLRYRLVDIPFKLHHPMWQEDSDIDLDYHVRQVQVQVRSPGGRRELDEVIGEICSTPLDRGRPLWVMYVAEGLADSRVAAIYKVHHALADGVASANMMGKAMTAVEPSHDGRGLLTAHPKRANNKLLRAAARDHIRQVRRLPGLVRQTAAGVSQVRRRSKERGTHPDLARAFAPPPTFMNHVVSPGRRFATAPMALSDVKETSKHLGVTINDLVLATAAGALRELLLRYDGTADSPLIAGVPVSFQQLAGSVGGQRVQLYAAVVAGARRGSAGAGAAGVIGRRDRQGGLPAARTDGGGVVAGVPAAAGRPVGVSQAVRACRVEQDHEPDDLQRSGRA